MMLVKALAIALMGYLGGGASPQSQDLHEREVIMYVRPNVIQAPAGENTLSLNSVTMPDGLRNVLVSYSAEYLTRPYPDYDPADTIAYSPDGRPVKKMDLSRLYRIRFPKGTDLDDVVDDLKGVTGVIFAERIPLLRLMAIPNDEFFQYQWGLHNTGQAGGTPGEDIHAVEAWDIFTGSSNVKIGIIDAGVKSNHEDLQGKVVSGESGYSDPHGTHVAGIATAMTNNGMGVAGVDWHARIDARDFGLGLPEEIYNDIVASVDAGSDVLNNSWALVDVYGNPLYSVDVRWAFHYAYEMNRVSVAAMGNEGVEQINFPAAFPVVLAVGATTCEGYLSDYSTYGSHIDVVAPGGENPYPNTGYEDILSTWIINAFQGKPYEFLAGTSMSTPFVTGLAALLKGFRPDLTNDDIMWIIRVSADDKPPSGWDEYTGYGRINAERALNLLRLPYEMQHLTASGGSIYDISDFYQMTFFAVPGLPDGVYLVKRYEIRQTVTLPANYVENYAWGIHTTTVGFSLENPNFGENWCRVIDNNGNQITLKTFVYDVYSVNGQHIGWLPTSPDNVIYGYTVLGRREINAPTQLTAQPSETSVTLTWHDNSDNEMGFLICRAEDGTNFDIIDTLWTNGNGSGQRNYTDSTVELGHIYWYKVQAFANGFTSDESEIEEVIINLSAPSHLHAQTQAPWRSIILSWRDNSNYEEGYEIQRKMIGSSGWTIVDTVADTCFIDDGVAPHLDYMYRVRAVAGEITSEFDTARCTASPSFENGAFYNNSSSKLIQSGSYLHLLYIEKVNPTKGFVKYTRSSISSPLWNEPITISSNDSCFSPAIAVGDNGELYGAWFKYRITGQPSYDYYTLIVARKEGDSWNNDSIYMEDASIHGGVTLSDCGIEAEGDTVYITWREKYQHGGSKIFFVSFDVNDMPTPQTVQVETVATASPFTTGPSLVVKNGIPIILFSSGNTMGDTIYMVQRTDSWSDPAYVSMGRNPVLKADNEGLYAVWENPGTGQIFYQKWPEGSLMPPARVIASYNPDDGYAYPNVVRLRNKVMALWLGKHEGEWCLFRRSWTEEVYPQMIGDAEPVAYAGYDGYPQVVAYSVSLGGDTVLPRRYLGGGMVPQPIRSHGLRRDHFVYAYVNEEDGYLAVKKEEGSVATVGGPMSRETRKAFKGGIISLEPNPVRRVLCVRYGLKERGPVEFRVYNAAGRIVKRAIQIPEGSGVHNFEVDLKEMKSGVYFLEYRAGSRREARKFMLLR